MDYLRKAFFKETNLCHADYWFQEEFNRALGLDIFEHDYDSNRGWCHFSSAPYEVLVLDTDLPDEQKSQCISDFIGISGFQIERHNITPPKGRAALYKAFKAETRFPEEMIDQVLNTRYTRHFYNEKAREVFRKKWQA